MSLKRFTAEARKSTGGKRSAIGSSLALDRDQEVLIPQGADTENFMKNPVMLQIHGYHQNAVGKVLDVKVKGGGMDQELVFDFEFADTEAGKELAYLYDNGFQKAFSIGLIPKAYHNIEEGFNEKSVDLMVKGSKFTLNLDGYKKMPRRIVTEYELLEISPVPVPSNPEALLRAAAGLSCKSFSSSKMTNSMIDHKSDDFIASLRKSMEALSNDGKIPTNLGQKLNEDEVDADEALVDLLGHFSEDGSGDLETVDYAKLSESFALVEVGADADNPESYMYLHHVLVDDEIQVSRSLLTEAIKNAAEVKSDALGHLLEHLKEFTGVELEEDTEITDEVINLAFSAKSSRSGGDGVSSSENEDDPSDSVKELKEQLETIQKDLMGLKVKTNLILRATRQKKDTSEGNQDDDNKEVTLEGEVLKGFEQLTSRLEAI